MEAVELAELAEPEVSVELQETVVPVDSVVTVELVRNTRRNAFLSVDGGKAIRMNVGDVATVKKSTMEAKLVRLKDRSFYDVINAKFKNA